MCTSTASKPAVSKQYAISTCEFTPCSRRIATWDATGSGTVPRHFETVRIEAGEELQAGSAGSPTAACSWSAHSGLSRCWQILQLTLSHTWCRSASFALNTVGVAPDLHLALADFDGRRRGTGLADEVAVLDRPCSRSTCMTSLRSAVRTCSSTPSSSLNSAFSVSSSRRAPTCVAQFLASPKSARLSWMPSPSVTSRSTLRLTPTWPAKAISQAAANRPPSLRSWTRGSGPAPATR